MKKTVKLFAILFVAMTMVTMTSCKKEDELSGNIVGIWKSTDYSIFLGSEVYDCYIFYSDGQYANYGIDSKNAISYEEIGTYTYSKDNAEVKLTEILSGSTTTLSVSKLTDADLTMDYSNYTRLADAKKDYSAFVGTWEYYTDPNDESSHYTITYNADGTYSDILDSYKYFYDANAKIYAYEFLTNWWTIKLVRDITTNLITFSDGKKLVRVTE